MRVETDDPEADWARPGVYQIDDHVYRIPMPLPVAGLQAVNAYAVTGDDGDLTLIDSGWATADARSALDRALATLDRSLGDVRRFLVTHAHRDHYGLAVALRREFGQQVSLGEGERPAVEALSDAQHRPLWQQTRLLDRWGAHPLAASLRHRTRQREHDPADWAAPDIWLAGGTDVAVAGRALRVVATPGHTRGHVVFVDEQASLMFAGDHVLPHITPSIGFEPAPTEQPLGDFLDSLRLVRAMPDRRLLPAHGPVQASVHARVDELLQHHARRLDAITATIGGDDPTAYQTAARLPWSRGRRTFADLDSFQQMLAVAETAAHLDLLVSQGCLKATDIDGVRHYAVR